jgi:hypothetical protein
LEAGERLCLLAKEPVAVFQHMHGNPHFGVCHQPDIILLAISFIIDRRS